MGKKFKRTINGRRKETFHDNRLAKERAARMENEADKFNIKINRADHGRYIVSYNSVNDNGNEKKYAKSAPEDNIMQEYMGDDDYHTYGHPDWYWD